MTDIKNSEQINADEALTRAVEGCLKAYMPEHASAYTLTDFVVLTSLQQITSEGVVVTRHPMFMSNGDLPWYRVLGLIDIHKLKAKNEILSGKDNG
jgi:hypothetical protein